MDKSKFGSDKRINKLHIFLHKHNGIDLMSSMKDQKPSNSMRKLLGIHRKNVNNHHASNLKLKMNGNHNSKRRSRRSLEIFEMEMMRMNDIKDDAEDEKSNDNDFDIPNEYVTTYIPPRKGVDDALDKYFKYGIMNNQKRMQVNNYNEILVCQKCAGYHDKHKCKEIVYTCHMCGEKGHRLFECKRAKCFSCLNIGHIAQHCPNRNVI